MKIISIRHKGLSRFIERGDLSGLPASHGVKIASMITVLSSIQDIDDLGSISKWKIHRLTGDRKGQWSFSVSRNWRLTFRCDAGRGEIFDLDFEDYH